MEPGAWGITMAFAHGFHTAAAAVPRITNAESGGLSLLSTLFGITALALSWVPLIDYLAIAVGAAGLTFGALGIIRSGRGLAVAGTLLGLAAIMIGLLTISHGGH